MPEKKLTPYLFLLPALAFFIIFFIYPNIDVFHISLYRWTEMGPEAFVGFGNFGRLFVDPAFWSWQLWFTSILWGVAGSLLGMAVLLIKGKRELIKGGTVGFLIGLMVGLFIGGLIGRPMGALERTFIIGIQSIFIQIPIALVIAVLLHGKIKGARTFSIIAFLPMMISLAALALTWQYMIYDLNVGALNRVLGFVGVAQTNWLMDAPLLSVILTTNWIYIGLYVVIFTSAMKSIPSSVFDSAKVDGLSGFQTIRRVVVPHLKKVIVLASIMCISGTFKAFDLLWILTGGPGSEVHITSTLLVTEMLRDHWGYACTIGVACFFICLFIVIIQLRAMRIKV